MTDKEVIKILNSAFSESVPEFDSSLLELCPDRGERSKVTVKFKIRMTKVAKIAIAAAVIMLLSATAAAISFAGVISENEAIFAGVNYVYEIETDPELQTELGYAIIGNLIYDSSAVQGEADIGLREGRLVYNVSFKTCGYAYQLAVDAKTGVVYTCERDTDPEWEDIKDELKVKAEEELEKQKLETMTFQDDDEALPDISYNYARGLFTDWFGIQNFERYDNFSLKRDFNSGCYVASATVEGYTYSAKVDMDTGEIIDTSVTEAAGYEGERILHEKDETAPSFEDICRSVVSTIREDYPETEGMKVEFTRFRYANMLECVEDYENVYTVVYDVSDPSWVNPAYEMIAVVDAQNGEILSIYKGSTDEEIASELMKLIGVDSMKSYSISKYQTEDKYGFTSDAFWKVRYVDRVVNKGVIAIVNIVTLEITDVEILETTPFNYEANETPSSEAKDGLISEAAAASVALEHSGVAENDVNALKVRLEGEVYTVSFNYGVESLSEQSYTVNTYHIDAKTGEIIDCDAITPDSYITPEEAEKYARECFIRLFELDEDVETEITENEFMILCPGAPVYRITVTSGEKTAEFTIDVINGVERTRGQW